MNSLYNYKSYNRFYSKTYYKTYYKSYKVNSTEICTYCKKYKLSSYCSNNCCKFCCTFRYNFCNHHHGIPKNIKNLHILRNVVTGRFNIPKDVMDVICAYIDNEQSCERCNFRRTDGEYKKCKNCRKLVCEKCSSDTDCCYTLQCKSCYNNHYDRECQDCESSRKFYERYESFKSYF